MSKTCRKPFFVSQLKSFRKKKWQERGAQLTTRSNGYETSNKRVKRVVEDTTRFNEFEVKVSLNNSDFCVRWWSNWKHWFLFFIVYIGLAAFIVSIFPSKMFATVPEFCFSFYNKILTKNNFNTYIQPPKGVQKNMLNAWNFTKSKHHHWCVDNNLQIVSRRSILENAIGQIYLTVALMVGLCWGN